MSTILVVCRWLTFFSDIKNSTGKAAQLCDRKMGVCWLFWAHLVLRGFEGFEGSVFLFFETCITVVDRVATKSMDFRESWGQSSARQRSGQKLFENWLEMLPCTRCMVLVGRRVATK